VTRIALAVLGGVALIAPSCGPSEGVEPPPAHSHTPKTAAAVEAQLVGDVVVGEGPRKHVRIADAGCRGEGDSAPGGRNAHLMCQLEYDSGLVHDVLVHVSPDGIVLLVCPDAPRCEYAVVA
jgi:hypothetical protein